MAQSTGSVTAAADALSAPRPSTKRSSRGLSGSSENPPPPPKIEPYKTPLAYVKERRSDKEAADILDEAIQTLRDKRKRGEIIF